MRLIHNYFSILALSIVLPTVAHAAPQVTFQGEVTSQTCKAVINGESEGTVLLPTVPVSELNTAGKTAGLTPFTISVSGCTVSTTSELKIGTRFLGHKVTTTGNLGNVATNNAAKNVSIQLTADANGSTPVKLNGVTTVQGLVLPINQSATSHQFAARYYAEDIATPGAITAVAEYTLSYP